jgi:hypothetical protein
LEILRHWHGILQARERSARGKARLGVSVQTEPRAGQVVVADVHTNGPSAGVLMPSDSVIACNDELLPIEGANERLRMLLADAPASEPVRLRVLRGGEFVEVAVGPLAGGAGPDVDPGMTMLLERLKPLDDLLLELDLAVYSVQQSVDGARHARLVLEFQRPASVAEPDSTTGANATR